MKASVISLLLPLALLAATRLLYRNNCRAMQRFYWRMVFLYSARRLYTLLLLLTLILVNTVFVTTRQPIILPSRRFLILKVR